MLLPQINLHPILLGVLGTQELIILLAFITIIVIIVAAVSKKGNTKSIAVPMSSPDGQNLNQQTVVVVNEGKSVGLAFLLAFLFGPLGLLYASVTGGIVMIILTIIIGFVTLGVGLIITWIICIVWAIIAAGNSKQNSTTVVTNNKSHTQIPKVETTPIVSSSIDKESLLNQLAQLHTLKEKGALTEEIYEQERQRILDKLAKAPQ